MCAQRTRGEGGRMRNCRIRESAHKAATTTWARPGSIHATKGSSRLLTRNSRCTRHRSSRQPKFGCFVRHRLTWVHSVHYEVLPLPPTECMRFIASLAKRPSYDTLKVVLKCHNSSVQSTHTPRLTPHNSNSTLTRSLHYNTVTAFNQWPLGSCSSLYGKEGPHVACRIQDYKCCLVSTLCSNTGNMAPHKVSPHLLQRILWSELQQI